MTFFRRLPYFNVNLMQLIEVVLKLNGTTRKLYEVILGSYMKLQEWLMSQQSLRLTFFAFSGLASLRYG